MADEQSQTPTLDKLGEWVGKYGIATVALVAFSWMFFLPLVDSHKQFLKDTVEVQKAQVMAVEKLEATVREQADELKAIKEAVQ